MNEKSESLRENIYEYIKMLDAAEYPQIKNRMNNDTNLNRLLDYIEQKLLDNPSMDVDFDTIIAQVEYSLYE